jgi:hypothetical protein
MFLTFFIEAFLPLCPVGHLPILKTKNGKNQSKQFFKEKTAFEAMLLPQIPCTWHLGASLQICCAKAGWGHRL